MNWKIEKKTLLFDVHLSSVLKIVKLEVYVAEMPIEIPHSSKKERTKLLVRFLVLLLIQADTQRGNQS